MEAKLPIERVRTVQPSVHEKAYNCPHCGALAKQFWFRTFLKQMKSDDTPQIWRSSQVEDLDLSFLRNANEGEEFREKLRIIATGAPGIGQQEETYKLPILDNVFVSQCFNCHKTAVWLYENMLYPNNSGAPYPNFDLPLDVVVDYREAASIVNKSPRGAAALLRLAIQKICVVLGGKGKNINDDIATLVRNGLDLRVQQALDIVRVIGNNAVHPGQIDLRDDRETAEKLFGLINLIADIMISQPKHVAEMFENLPDASRLQITSRDS